jgi:hypothetical protein
MTNLNILLVSYDSHWARKFEGAWCAIHFNNIIDGNDRGGMGGEREPTTGGLNGDDMIYGWKREERPQCGVIRNDDD